MSGKFLKWSSEILTSEEIASLSGTGMQDGLEAMEKVKINAKASARAEVVAEVREKITEALVHSYCTAENQHKEMDVTLIKTMEEKLNKILDSVEVGN